jgi:hypothetical protein
MMIPLRVLRRTERMTEESELHGFFHKLNSVMIVIIRSLSRSRLYKEVIL